MRRIFNRGFHGLSIESIMHRLGNVLPRRVAICGGLSWIGISLDEARNRSASNPIHDSASRCEVLVLTSQEDEQIARHTRALI